MARTAADLERGKVVAVRAAVAPVDAGVGLGRCGLVRRVELGAGGNNLAGNGTESTSAGGLGDPDVIDRVGDGVDKSKRHKARLSKDVVAVLTRPGKGAGRVNGVVDAYSSVRAGGRRGGGNGTKGLAEA